MEPSSRFKITFCAVLRQVPPVCVIKFIYFILLVLSLGCASGTYYSSYSSGQDSTYLTKIEKALYNEAKLWKGTPHRMGGMDKSGTDCSGLVVRIYKDLFNVDLPRSTKLQIECGKSVSKRNLQAGDLVFFKPGFKKRHVGIYIENGNFLHASAGLGVTISRLDNPYWHTCYWKSRRIITE